MVAFLEWLSTIGERLLPYVILDPWEAGVRVRFGRWVKELQGGIHFTIPIFDNVESINKLKQWEPVPEQTVETADHIPMLVEGVINYEIKHPLKLWMKVQDHDESLAAECAVLLARWINSHEYEEITIVRLEAECGPIVRENGFKWGCEVHALGIRTLSKHRAYRLLMS